MATFRGVDGSVTLGGTAIGEVTSWSLQSSKDLLEDTAMGDSAKTFKVGLGEHDVQIAMHLDYGDAQQASFIDDIVGSGSTSFALVLIVDTGKSFALTGVCYDFNPTAELGGIISGNASFRNDDATGVTVAWA